MTSTAFGSTPSPSSISNRTLIKTMQMWGWTAGKTNNGLTVMHSPSGLSLSVAAADSHTSNQKAAFDRLAEIMSVPWATFIDQRSETERQALADFNTLSTKRRADVWRSGGLIQALSPKYVQEQLDLEAEAARRHIRPARPARPVVVPIPIIEEPAVPEPVQPEPRSQEGRGTAMDILEVLMQAKRPMNVDELAAALPDRPRETLSSSARWLIEKGKADWVSQGTYQYHQEPPPVADVPPVTSSSSVVLEPTLEEEVTLDDSFDALFENKVGIRVYRKHHELIEQWRQVTLAMMRALEEQ